MKHTRYVESMPNTILWLDTRFWLDAIRVGENTHMNIKSFPTHYRLYLVAKWVVWDGIEGRSDDSVSGGLGCEKVHNTSTLESACLPARGQQLARRAGKDSPD